MDVDEIIAQARQDLRVPSNTETITTPIEEGDEVLEMFEGLTPVSQSTNSEERTSTEGQTYEVNDPSFAVNVPNQEEYPMTESDAFAFQHQGNVAGVPPEEEPDVELTNGIQNGDRLDVEHPTMEEFNAEIDNMFNQEPSPLEEEEAALLNPSLLEPEVAPLVENSASTEEEDTTLRFKGAPWYEIVKQQTITLAGVGGIGSWAALMLSRMHPKAMFLYDADRVESVNMAGQLYGISQIGLSKVSASTANINNFSDYYDVFGINEFFTVQSEASNIMICGFDSMSSRRAFFNKWLFRVDYLSESEKKKCLFIDGRMSAESIQVFCIVGNDTYSINKYRTEWLFMDSEAESTVCSYKQTTFCAGMIGAIINNLFVNFCTNLGEPLIDRDLPFLTTYEAENMYFKTER